MSTYVMSDLHGEVDLFHTMLEKCDFPIRIPYTYLAM